MSVLGRADQGGAAVPVRLVRVRAAFYQSGDNIAMTVDRRTDQRRAATIVRQFRSDPAIVKQLDYAPVDGLDEFITPGGCAALTR
jgi:hypothetical protein